MKFLSSEELLFCGIGGVVRRHGVYSTVLYALPEGEAILPLPQGRRGYVLKSLFSLQLILGEKEIVRAGLGVDPDTPGFGPSYLFEPLFRADVDYINGTSRGFGYVEDPGYRLCLDEVRPGSRVVYGSCLSLVDELFGEIIGDISVLAMNHGDPTGVPYHRHGIVEVVIARHEPSLSVGREELEAFDAHIY